MSVELPKVLPRGRHAAPRHVVEESQRGRLLEAIASEVAAHGYAATSVADVIARAGVSRKSFYEHFANKEDCFLQAFDAGTELMLQAIEAAVAAEPDPISGWVAGVRAYLESFAERPDFARTYLIEVLAAGPDALAHRSEVHARFAEQLRRQRERAREVLPALADVPDHRFRATVGAINELVSEHVRTHGAVDAEGLAGPVLDVLLAMLAGERAAGLLGRAPGPPSV